MTEVTGRAVGFLAACPELPQLERAPLAPHIFEHVDVCESCQLVLELLAFGDIAGMSVACARFEPLIAARGDSGLGAAASELLAAHLAACADCRTLADTLPPDDEHAGLDALPEVSPENYVLGAEVARGGMGRIFAARDLRVGRSVAVKELRQRSRELASRFAREARITARLQHPGIVPIYEIGRWPDGTPFYSMRMVDGGTLHQAIVAAATLAKRLALLPAVIAATEAVAFAHAQRIIHRDLTPANVLVGAYGETVVIDWGLAKEVGQADEAIATPETSSPELTNAGAVVGTAAFMSPEQARAEPVDERTDVYALGAILYHLLAGEPPYHGRDAIEQLRAGAPPAIERVAPAAPRDLQSIVNKAMARDPAARYATAKGLAEELSRFQAGRIVEAHSYTTGERMRRFIKRNRAPVTVTAIAAAILGVLGFIAVRRVLRERATAERTVVALLEEEGRSELLDGDSQRALAYFDAATAGGAPPTRALAFMRARALGELTTVVADLECGGTVNDLGFDPTGTQVIASCHDRARAWRLSDRAEVRTYEPCNGGCDHLEYSHDGKKLVTYGADGKVRLWDVASGALLRTFAHGDRTITFATFTPDDQLIATTGYDGYARIWDVQTGAKLRDIRGSNSLILSHLYGVISADGTRILTFTIEGTGAGFDIRTGKKIGDVEHGPWAIGGAISPDGRLAATCGTNRLVKLWDTSSPRLVAILPGATDAVLACKFSDDGARVIGTSQDGHAYVWDVETQAMVSQANHGTTVWTGHFSHDGSRFVTVGVGNTIKVWDTETGGLLATHDSRGGHEARFSPDGEFLISARGDGRVRIWRDPGGPLRATYEPQGASTVAAYTGDGTRVVVVTGDNAALIDSATHVEIRLAAPVGEPVAAGTDRIAATLRDGRVVVISAATGATVATLDVGRHAHALAFAGALLIVEQDGGAPQIWDVATAARRLELADADHALVAAGEQYAVAWRDRAAPAVWDLTSGARVRVLETTGAPIAIAQDGTVIVEDRADDHRTASLWRIDNTHDAIGEVDASPTLDPTGRFVTAVLADHGVRTLDLLDHHDATFFAGPLQTAQADPSGELVVGVDRRGTAVSVFNSRDGRELAHWPIAHPTLALLQDTLLYPSASARWSADGSTIVSKSRQVARWDASAPQVLAPSKIAWRVVGAKLIHAKTTLHATVTRDGTPLANERLGLVFRKPGELASGAPGWESTVFKSRPYAVTTDGDGAFTIADLDPGTYELTYRTRTLLVDLEVDDAERTFDLSDAEPARSRSP